jgi:NTP pyrophosphatase (non-canonical NTP hydrolase)
MSVKDLRDEIKKRYYDLDRKSGELFLLAVLFEEVGELAEAVRKGVKDDVEEELADVLFMILSLANFFGVEPDIVLVEKYLQRNPSDRWDLPSDG